MKRLLTILFLLLLLCGCSPQITEGEVYDKEFKPEETVMLIMPMIISNGKTSQTIMIPYFYHYPDRYIIYIRQYNDEEDKYITEDFYVNKEVYDAVTIGAEFNFTDDMGSCDEPYTRERVREDKPCR